MSGDKHTPPSPRDKPVYGKCQRNNKISCFNDNEIVLARGSLARSLFRSLRSLSLSLSRPRSVDGRPIKRHRKYYLGHLQLCSLQQSIDIEVPVVP